MRVARSPSSSAPVFRGSLSQFIHMLESGLCAFQRVGTLTAVSWSARGVSLSFAATEGQRNAAGRPPWLPEASHDRGARTVRRVRSDGIPAPLTGKVAFVI